MVCEANGCVIEERDKPKMLADGEWRATAAGDGRTAGFHLPALYSPVRELGRHRRRVPDRAARPAATAAVDEHQVGRAVRGPRMAASSRRPRRSNGLRTGATACQSRPPSSRPGVDVQGDRLAVEIVAWGLGEESWSLDYSELWGDPAKADVWRTLDHDLMRRFDHPRAGPMPVRAVCVDSGGHLDAAGLPVRARARRAECLGDQGAWRASACLYGPGGRQGPAQAVFTPFILGVDAAKELIVARFDLEDGPGRCHWPIGRDLDYFQMLGAERIVRTYRRGVAIRQWKKDPARQKRGARLPGLRLCGAMRPGGARLPARRRIAPHRRHAAAAREGHPGAVAGEDGHSVGLDGSIAAKTRRPQFASRAGAIPY